MLKMEDFGTLRGFRLVDREMSKCAKDLPLGRRIHDCEAWPLPTDLHCPTVFHVSATVKIVKP